MIFIAFVVMNCCTDGLLDIRGEGPDAQKAAGPGLPSLPHPVFLPLVPAELEVPSPSGTPMDIILPEGAKPTHGASCQIPLILALGGGSVPSNIVVMILTK